MPLENPCKYEAPKKGPEGPNQGDSRPVSGSIKAGVEFRDSNTTSTEAERVAT